MSSSLPTIREIDKKDNAPLAAAIRAVFVELFDPRGVSKCGTAFEDPHLNHLFEEYNKPKAVYFVIEKEGRILGGAGIKKLDNYEGNVCELQKMYFLPEARGLGLGAQMIQLCLEKAREFGFEQCYLETMPFMEDAQKLYKKFGFEYIDHPMGGTGHYSCPVWMLRKL
ncbi:MAG: GNAT family N-acetyltransferase [Flavobacteriaceae bacterium]|nr:GNAT family N-acetyltransferase [Flavobacteriaceae bacterium]